MSTDERIRVRQTSTPTRIAILIPCYNESVSIGKVVADFRAAVPDAKIYVYDNNSCDDTVNLARAAGALIRREGLQGKGNVVRRAFSDIEADVYMLVDGDDTYDADAARAMIDLLINDRLDMVTGARVTDIRSAYRPGHRLGNRVLTGLVGMVFGNRVSDILSGYRVFSRRFVKSFPALAGGFEIEVEFTIHALDLKVPMAEVQTRYKDRPSGSLSKLNTYADGLRILRTILVLVKEERPLAFFSFCAGAILAVGLAIGAPVVSDFWRTGLVLRLPSAVLSAVMVLMAFLSLVCGLVLDSVSRGRKEIKRMAYLSFPPVEASDE